MSESNPVRSAALAAALALLALTWLAVPSARAQDEDPADLACIVFEELINEGVAFCLEAGCEPTEKDCQKLCKNGTKTCNAISKDSVKLADDIVKAQVKQGKILCKTADDPSGCKSFVKEGQQAAKMFSKDFKKEAKEACKASDLVDRCLNACNLGETCACEGGPDLMCE